MHTDDVLDDDDDDDDDDEEDGKGVIQRTDSWWTKKIYPVDMMTHSTTLYSFVEHAYIFYVHGQRARTRSTSN
jgi:hypothetical protein